MYVGFMRTSFARKRLVGDTTSRRLRGMMSRLRTNFTTYSSSGLTVCVYTSTSSMNFFVKELM